MDRSPFLPCLRLCAALLALSSIAVAQPALVKDIKKGPNNSRWGGGGDAFVTMGGLAFFAADDGSQGGASVLYRSNGSAAGTFRLSSQIRHPSSLTVVGKKLFFVGRTAQQGQELHVSDGTTPGTKLVLDVHRGAYDGCRRILGVLGNEVFFWGVDSTAAAGHAIWRSDGTAKGTTLVQRVSASTLNHYNAAGHFVAFGKHLYFVAYNSSSGRSTLVRTDGKTLTNFSPFGVRANVIGIRCVFKQRLYVSIYNLRYNRFEMWALDGTLTGKRLAAIGIWDQMTPCGDTMFFAARLARSQTVAQLWKTDGTDRGTKPVTTRVWPHGLEVRPSAAMLDDGKMVFSGMQASKDVEPWSTDGTDAGTVRLANVNASGPSNPQYFTRLGDGGLVAFQPNSPTSGREWWISDGSPRGTRITVDHWPGVKDGASWTLNRLGDRYLFWGGDAKYGFEPRVFSIKWAGGTVVDEYGAGCKGSAGITELRALNGAPKLGNNKFALQLDKARATAASALFVSARPFNVALGKGGCRLLVDPAVAVIEGRVTDGNGRWTLPLPIPAVSALVGLDLYWQAWVFDPNGALNPPGLSGSNGLRTLLGR